MPRKSKKTQPKQKEQPVIDYLELPTVKSKQSIITHAPLNSSGDIYHVLAYLILVVAFKKTLPDVLLTYDNESTKKQVVRSQNFAATLGLGALFRTMDIGVTNNTFRENVRQARLEKYLKMNYPETVYVDQMATTTVIARLFLRFGFNAITQLLKQGFSWRDKKYFPESAQQAVDDFVVSEINELGQKKVAKEQPVVVVHLRYSSHANNHLNVPDNAVAGLIRYLQSAGYGVWCILADDRVRLPHYPSTHTTLPFSKPIIENGIDYSKQAHLNLLLKLTELPNIKGIVGNTSGTLDVAAFVGNRVYNIHQFNKALSYQDWRLMMQLTFLSVEDLFQATAKSTREVTDNENASNDSLGRLVQELLPNFIRWLTEEVSVRPSIHYPDFKTKIDNAGFKKMFSVVYMGNKPTRFALRDIEQFTALVDRTASQQEEQCLLAPRPR